MDTKQQSEISHQRIVVGSLAAAVLLVIASRLLWFVPIAEIVIVCVSILGLYLFWRFVVAIEEISRKT